MKRVNMTPARLAFAEATDDVVRTLEKLRADGREDRATGLAVAADLGTSAAFLFDTSDWSCEQATRGLREAIEQATR